MNSIPFLTNIICDGLFAAIAAIGFSLISNPPRKTLMVSALLAAIGHSIRYFLMHAEFMGWSITVSSFIAALSIGILSIPMAKRLRVPAEVFAFPSLLPMIPGMFAYRAIQSLAKILENSSEESVSLHYINLFFYNGITSVFILFSLVIGVSIPIFVFRKQAFSSTR